MGERQRRHAAGDLVAAAGRGAAAALLGLAGSGLLLEFKPAGGPVVLREARQPRRLRSGADRSNCPLPTVLPAFSTALTAEQMQFASVHNGFLMKDTTGAWLGGAQGFDVTWRGRLLVEEDGTYEFWAGAPRPAMTSRIGRLHRTDSGGSSSRRTAVGRFSPSLAKRGGATVLGPAATARRYSSRPSLLSRRPTSPATNR